MAKGALGYYLIIRGSLVDTGGGTLQYNYQINTVHPRGRFYTFIQYTTWQSREKSNPNNNRNHIARDLRRKHANVWRLFHEWKATHFP